MINNLGKVEHKHISVIREGAIALHSAQLAILVVYCQIETFL